MSLKGLQKTLVRVRDDPPAKTGSNLRISGTTDIQAKIQHGKWHSVLESMAGLIVIGRNYKGCCIYRCRKAIPRVRNSMWSRTR